MEIRHLQTFLTIVELEGFTKTADHLGYAQSTITSHIQILEGELGEAIFDRLGKKVILTNVGKQLIPYAKEMLKLYGEIKSITSDKDKVSGDLIIGAGESLCIYRLGKIFKEYKEKYPNVNLIIKNSSCSDLRSKLHSGEIDMVFTIEPEIEDRNLVVNKLKDEKLVLISSNTSDLDLIKSDKENKIGRRSVLFTEKGCSCREKFKKYLNNEEIKYSNTLEFSSIEVIKNCAINGLGISLLQFYIVENEVKTGIIKCIDVEEKYNNFKTQMVYHKDKNISNPMKKLIEITLNNASRW